MCGDVCGLQPSDVSLVSVSAIPTTSAEVVFNAPTSVRYRHQLRLQLNAAATWQLRRSILVNSVVGPALEASTANNIQKMSLRDIERSRITSIHELVSFLPNSSVCAAGF